MHWNSTNKRTKLFFQDREIGQLRLPACDRTGGRAPHLLFRYLWIFNQDPLLTNVDKLLSRKAHIRTPKWLCPNALPFAKLANQKCYRRMILSYQCFIFPELSYTCDEKHLRRFRMAFYLSIAWLCDSEEYATRQSIEQLYKD
ncbi:hypothetical protein T4A_7428 [Trichinella pseudospiralis]|uniref:Uncharacterized protein n=1 Tax=Trichinella pseudospiralis TaxID=6337 RepID=A0A0V1EIN9_TRIPS|nr:hypothetical protein T4A_7428 [Trichinella pseudospiralis]KRZ38886.1 hypothetical protein T4C_4400 [Trichinella pseudospiralis]